MEGDVEGVMAQPQGTDPDTVAERDKWDAWHNQHGVSRTEAKRRYITTLISTMHQYASPTPEARELVSELEFVWDQIKSQPGSEGSGSGNGMGGSGLLQPPQLQSMPSYASIGPRGSGGNGSGEGMALRVLSPMSQGDEEEPLDAEGVDLDEEEDDKQYPESGDAPLDRRRSGGASRTGNEVRNRKWRRRVEQALTRMTAEVAALREQMESSRVFGNVSGKKRRSLWAWIKWLVWVATRQVLIDAVMLGCLALWMRMRGDRRLDSRLKQLWSEVRLRLEKIRWKIPGFPIRLTS